MADIFQEVEEDVRRERFERLWKRIAPAVIAIAVIAVGTVAGVTGWRHYVASERAASSDRFNAALNLVVAGDRAGAIAQFGALAGSAREPYATLARLRQAMLMAESGDQAAAAVFAETAQKTDDPLIRDFAELMGVVNLIDREPAAGVIVRLEPLAAPDKPWRALARDYLAFLLFQSQDVTRARAIWNEILQDETAAPAQKARARELLAATSAGETKGTRE